MWLRAWLNFIFNVLTYLFSSILFADLVIWYIAKQPAPPSSTWLWACSASAARTLSSTCWTTCGPTFSKRRPTWCRLSWTPWKECALPLDPSKCSSTRYRVCSTRRAKCATFTGRFITRCTLAAKIRSWPVIRASITTWEILLTDTNLTMSCENIQHFFLFFFILLPPFLAICHFFLHFFNHFHHKYENPPTYTPFPCLFG